MYQTSAQLTDERQLEDRSVSLIGMFEMEDIHNSSSFADLNPCVGANVSVTQGFGNESTDIGKSEIAHSDSVRKMQKKSGIDPVVNEWFKAVSSGDVELTRSLCGNKLPVDSRNELGQTALHISTEMRNTEIVELLITSGGDVNVQDHNGVTPLHIAARANSSYLVNRLITHGGSVTVSSLDGMTPLHCCCQTGDGCDIATILMGIAPDMKNAVRRTKQGVSGITALHDAVEVGDLLTVKLLVNHSVDVNAASSCGMTALHLAAKHGYVDIANVLIISGARIDIPASDGKGVGVLPVHLAAEFNHSEMVNALVAAGSDVMVGCVYSGRDGVSCVHLAAMKRSTDMIRTILAVPGAMVNARDADGATSLHIAARSGFTDIAQILLKRGADIDIGMTYGQSFDQTPLHCAVRFRHHELARALIRAGANINATEKMVVTNPATGDDAAGELHNDAVSGYTALHWAVENGDLDMVCLLLDHDADPNIVASFDKHSGVTALHLASQDGYSAIAQELLRIPGCIRDPLKRTENRDNITPLHQAVYNGHADTARILIEGGCDVNRQAGNGYSALHYAAQQGNVELTRLMLKRGGDVKLVASAGDQQNITCLHLAVQSGNTDVVRALIESGAQVDACKTMGNVSGVTALHQAVYQEKHEVVKTLLECGANVNASMGGWYTPVHIAAEKGSVVITEELLKFGANVNARAKLLEHSGLTPLHVAAQHGHSELVSLLIAAGSELEALRTFSERSSITALHLASENGFLETVQALIDAGAELNSRDSMGFTALHLAIQYNFPNIVRLLISSGCNTRIKTYAGMSASKMAEQSDNVDLRNAFTEEKKKASSRKPIKTDKSEISVATVTKTKKKKHSRFMSLLCGLHKS